MTKTAKQKREKEPLDPVQHALALRLRSLREARFPPVSQGDIANLVGRTRSAVCLWENGDTEPSCSNLVKLAKFYGVSVNSLLGQEEAPAKPHPQRVPEFHTVPVLSEVDMLTWSFGNATENMVTRQRYEQRSAAAMRVQSGALGSLCPMGSHAVVVPRKEVNEGEVVVVGVEGETAPLIRKVVRDGSRLLLIADDARYTTVQLNARTRIIGRVVEIVDFRAL